MGLVFVACDLELEPRSQRASLLSDLRTAWKVDWPNECGPGSIYQLHQTGKLFSVCSLGWNALTEFGRVNSGAKIQLPSPPINCAL